MSLTKPTPSLATTARKPESATLPQVVELHGSNGNGKPAPAANGNLPLFQKVRDYHGPDQMRTMGLYPYFRMISSAQDTEVVMNGQKVLMLGSNSYLGLTNDPRIKEAVEIAVRKYGSGCAGSRFLNGTLDLHIQLEEEL